VHLIENIWKFKVNFNNISQLKFNLFYSKLFSLLQYIIVKKENQYCSSCVLVKRDCSQVNNKFVRWEKNQNPLGRGQRRCWRRVQGLLYRLCFYFTAVTNRLSDRRWSMSNAVEIQQKIHKCRYRYTYINGNYATNANFKFFKLTHVFVFNLNSYICSIYLLIYRTHLGRFCMKCWPPNMTSM